MAFLSKTQVLESLGIDISSSSVKVVGLKKNEERCILNAYARVPLLPGAVVEKEIKRPIDVSNAIKKAISLSRSKHQYAQVALGDSSVITNIIKVPRGLTELEFEEYVLAEADKHIPYPIDEIQLDYHALPSSDETLEYEKVFIAAAESKIVQRYIEVIEDANLIPKLLDVESFAMRKACNYCIAGFKTLNTVAVIDIGSSRTTVVVYHDNQPVFYRTELFGSEFLLKDISTQTLDFLTYSNKMDSKVYEEFKAGARSYIKRALQFYSSTKAARKIEKLVMSGSAALLAGLDQLIAQDMEIELEVADPVAKFSIGGKVDIEYLSESSPAMMIGVGLALRGMD